jgi:hypothetical protein
MDKEKPTNKIGEVADYIVEGLTGPGLTKFFRENSGGFNLNNLEQVEEIFDTDEESTGGVMWRAFIVNAAKAVGYGQSWKNATLVNKINETTIREYVDACWMNRDKQVIGQDQFATARNLAIALRNNDYTKAWFAVDEPGKKEIFYQVPVVWNQPISVGSSIMMVPCKGMIDIMIIHHDKKIVQLGDLKATSDFPGSFPYHFLHMGYYIQGSMYTTAVKYAASSENDAVIYNPYWEAQHDPAEEVGDLIVPESPVITNEDERFLDISGYTVVPMEFIVGSFKAVDSPLRYRMTGNDVLCGMEGGETKNGHEIVGWLKLLEDYMWHKEHDLWLYRRNEYESKGRVKLDMFNKQL